MALELVQVSKIFDNTKKDTIKHLSLTVSEGEFVCLVGPSGCGKSTILNLIAGLDTPTEGEVLLDGKKIEGPGADRVMMFQDAALFPWLNVLENVKFGLQIAGKTTEEQEETALHYLDLVKLSKFRNYRIHELSGGMRQRVALARCLALNSKILLMDEPFSALDKQTINILRDEVEKIWEATKKTVVMVTHSVEEAIFFADRVVIISSNPGSVRKEIKIELPRPRHIENEEFMAYRHAILKEVREEVEKSEKEELKL